MNARVLSQSLLLVFCALVAAMSLAGQRGPLTQTMPHIAYYLESVPVALYAHIIFGPLALLVMPFQFMTRLRAKRPKVHRTFGYIYVVSIAISALASLVMVPNFKGTLWAASGFTALAVLWVAVTFKAVMSARARDFSAHRRWMIRSATLTFAAVTLRLIMIPLMISGWTILETYNVTAWGSWVPVLLFVEWRILKSFARRA